MRMFLGGILAAAAAAALAAAQDDVAGKAIDSVADPVRFDLARYRDRVEEDGSASRTFEARILLRTAAAVAEYGQILVPYVAGLGQVQIENLVVEKPGGRKVDARSATTEDINPFGITGTSADADIRIKKVTVPGLEPGDVLSYQVVVHQKPLTPGRIFGEMKLVPAMGDPVQSYELDLPRKAGVKARLRDGLGATWEELSAPPDRLVRKIALFVPRPGADNKAPDKATREGWSEPDVLYSNFGSWPEVAGWWWDLARGRLAPDSTIKAEAATLVATAASPRDKVAALHRYVASRIRYLNLSFGIGRMQPRPAPDILANRYGDCKDKHALLAALAEALGVDIRPVLIHSLRSDLRDDVPGPQQFDHMISVARLGPDPADWLWLDATNSLALPGYLAPGLRDKRALLVERSGDGILVRTPADPPFQSRTEVELKGAMDAEGKLKARAIWRFRSDLEIQIRAAFAAMPQDRQGELIRTAFAADWPEGKVSRIVVSDPADVSEPFRIEFEVESGVTPDRERSWSLQIPLPPIRLPNPDQGSDTPPEPIVLELNESVVRAEFDIPEGFTLEAPLSVTLQRSYGSFESTYSVAGRRIAAARTLKLIARSVPVGDLKSYEAFYRAVETDRGQKFSVLGSVARGEAASARDFHTQGLAAFERKDYTKAVELLAKATESDAKIKDGFLDMGRALREAGRNDKAIAAFGRQIEIEPFHETSYAERAHTLIELDRWQEAEKDLLKQIEVAPFKSWSYERLGYLRLWEGRFPEAVDYYARAAAIEPKEAERWLDLGSAQQKAGRLDDARGSLERARGLDPPDWVKVRAAEVYERLGDLPAAGELAEDALSSLSSRLARLTSEDFDTKDLYWVDRLLEGWRFIGSAALASGDEVKAARYLSGAWKIGFLPEAGQALGSLRTKQGRRSEALDLLHIVSSVPSVAGTLSADLKLQIAALDRGAPRSINLNGLMDLRTIRLTGPVLKDLTEDVLLLVGADGRVEKLKGISPRKPTDLDRQIARLGPTRLPLERPDERSFKIVRRGLLACSAASGCALVLDVPGVDHSATPGSVNGDSAPPTLEITLVKPDAGGALRRGEAETAILIVRCPLKTAREAEVSLRVRDQAGQSLVLPGQDQPQLVKGEGEVRLVAEFRVPLDATRVDVVPEIRIVGTNIQVPITATAFAVQ